MNWVMLGLSVGFVLFAIGTLFWMVATLGPIRRKQQMRKEQQQRKDLDAD